MPLILSAHSAARARDRPRRPAARLSPLAGFVFGAAALTRSMPLFFAVPAACAHVDRWRATGDGRASRQGACVSRRLPAPDGAVLRRAVAALRPGHRSSTRTGAFTSTRHRALARRACSKPPAGLWTRDERAAGRAYFAECVARARSLLHVNGGRHPPDLRRRRLEAERGGVEDDSSTWDRDVTADRSPRSLARPRRRLVPAAADRRPVAAVDGRSTSASPASAGSAARGFACRSSRCSSSWRRSSLPGGWRRPHPAAVVAACRGRPSCRRSRTASGSADACGRGRTTASSGLRSSTGPPVNSPARPGSTFRRSMASRPSRWQSAGSSPIQLRMRVGGVHVQTMDLAAGETRTVRTLWPARGLAFIELDQIGPAGERPAIEVRVPGR